MMDHLSSKDCAVAGFTCTTNQAVTAAIACSPKLRTRMTGLKNKYTDEQCELMRLCSTALTDRHASGEEIPMQIQNTTKKALFSKDFHKSCRA
jgi:hypothetical protein